MNTRFILRTFNMSFTQIRMIKKVSRRPIDVIPSSSMDHPSVNDYVKNAFENSASDALDTDEIIRTQSRKARAKPVYPRPELHEDIYTKIKKPILPNSEAYTNLENNDDSLKVDDFESKNPIGQVKLPGLLYRSYYKTPTLKYLLAASKTAAQRRKADVILLEGWRQISEALAYDLTPKAIFYSRSNLLKRMAPHFDTKEELICYLNKLPLFKTPYKSLQTWSSLVTSPGIMGLFSYRQAEEILMNERKWSVPATFILDGIRMPENLGSILRTIAAVGVKQIIITKGCCDLWDVKVLRSAAGAHFHMQVANKVNWESIEEFLGSQPSVFISNTSAVLNRSQGFEEDLSDGELSDSNEEGKESGEETDEEEQIEKLSERQDPLYKFELPMRSYDEVNYFASVGDKFDKESNCVLIIGGETGLSPQAKNFALSNYSVQVAIPMRNNIDSLNSSVATGVIAYEMRRQYELHNKNLGSSSVSE